MSEMTRQQLCAARKQKAEAPVRQHRDGPLQAELLPGLVQHIPGCKLTGWREATMKAFQSHPEVVGVEDDFWDALKAMELIPDAFVIHPETDELHFFEVEIRHILTNTKLQEYARFLTVMDYYGIEFAVFSVNQHGHINQVSLLPHYITWVKAQQAERQQ
jgi:hypothetical protein